MGQLVHVSTTSKDKSKLNGPQTATSPSKGTAIQLTYHFNESLISVISVIQCKADCFRYSNPLQTFVPITATNMINRSFLPLEQSVSFGIRELISHLSKVPGSQQELGYIISI